MNLSKNEASNQIKSFNITQSILYCRLSTQILSLVNHHHYYIAYLFYIWNVVCTFYLIFGTYSPLTKELLIQVKGLFDSIHLQAETRQETYWVINAKPTYCRSLQTLL